MRRVVVLPAPFGPSRPRICPASQVRSTPSTTRFPPRSFTRPRASRSNGIDPRLYGRRARSQPSRAGASAARRLWHNRPRGPILARRRLAMKNGFKVLDSDLHTMEPDGLWERYLDEPFKQFAPRFARREDNAPNQPVIAVGNLEIAEFSKRPRTALVGKSLHERAFARHPHYAAAHARGYDAETHLQAMDIEGIDVAVIYGTRGRQVLMHDDHDPQVAAALARAHNNWTRDFCARDPARLKFAAQLAFHYVPSAVAEAHRAVRELGAVAVIGNPNPIHGRHVHDPALDPLWDAVEIGRASCRERV